MKKKLVLWGGAGVALLLLSIVVSLSMGSARLPIADVWRILVHGMPLVGDHIRPNWPESSEQIVMKVRLPRVILAMLIGAALSIAGAGFQGVLRNPLADPYTLGVASGASVGASFLIITGMQFALFGMWTIPFVAFLTGIVTLCIVLVLANVGGKFQIETLLLSGVIVNAFLGAMVSFMMSISNKVVNEIVFWTLGSLQMRGWPFVLPMLPYLGIGAVILLGFGRPLNLFALGERQAAYMGVSVERTKYVVLIVSTLITAAAVSVSGVVGFVGLVIPHLLRLAVGPDYRLILPLSLVYGSIYVLWADTLARMLISPKEINLGVITAMLGAPFFIYLLYRHKKRMMA